MELSQMTYFLKAESSFFTTVSLFFCLTYSFLFYSHLKQIDSFCSSLPYFHLKKNKIGAHIVLNYPVMICDSHVNFGQFL